MKTYSDITTLTTRRITSKTHKVFVESFSWERDPKGMLFPSIGPWSNCLYLYFIKEDFPCVVYPKLVPCDWLPSGVRFEYNEGSLATLNWHGGITFYEERFNPETNKTMIKVGCDYQHYNDDAYTFGDHGKQIVETDGITIMSEFIERFGVKP